MGKTTSATESEKKIVKSHSQLSLMQGSKCLKHGKSSPHCRECFSHLYCDKHLTKTGVSQLKYRCRECATGICPHGVEMFRCAEIACKNQTVSFCQWHGKLRDNCKACRTVSHFCQGGEGHFLGRAKLDCIKCTPALFCVHEIRSSRCSECSDNKGVFCLERGHNPTKFNVRKSNCPLCPEGKPLFCFKHPRPVRLTGNKMADKYCEKCDPVKAQETKEKKERQREVIAAGDFFRQILADNDDLNV